MTQLRQGWTAYRIEPLQPVVFRSGRPFGTGATADGANDPLPSAASGLVRTLHAQDAAGGRAQYDPAALQTICQVGPLLVRGADDGAGAVTLADCWLSRPADALYMDDGAGGVVVRRLIPERLPDGVGCDMPDGLLPVVQDTDAKGKPRSGPPWWSLAQWLQWRCGDVPTWDKDWQEGLPMVVRSTHVALDDGTRAARQGQLYQLESRDLGPRLGGGPGWAFLILSNARVADQLATFGGEGRLSKVQHDPRWERLLRAPDPALLARAEGARGVVLTLLTPAIFAHGWRPGWLDADGRGAPPECPDVCLALRAAAVDRWVPVSGWDLASGKPKAMRKAVPAGAVYWFDVLQGDVTQALHALWMAALSDGAEDRAQGFGAALPAPWHGDVQRHGSTVVKKG